MAPIATLSLMCTAPAQTYGISVFLPFIRAELGLSPAQTAGAYMLGTLLASVPMTWVGATMDRFGLRRTMTVVIVCYCLACVLISRVTGLLTLFLAFFVLRLFGQGALTMLSANTLAFWFHRRLGLMSGLKSIGSALAIGGAPALHYLLIRHLGWRLSYQLLGVMIAALLLPLMLFIYRSRPQDVGQQVDGGSKPPCDGAADGRAPAEWTLRDAVRTRAYWVFATGIALWAFIGTSVGFCASSIFEARGMAPHLAAEQVSLLFAAMGTTLFLAPLVAGWLADRLPMQYILFLALCGMATVAGVVRHPDSHTFVWAIGVAMGVSQSLSTAVGATVWVRYFGRGALGRIRGSTFTLMVAASSLGPVTVDGLAVITGSYERGLVLLMLLPVPLAVAALFTRRPRRPVSAPGGQGLA